MRRASVRRGPFFPIVVGVALLVAAHGAAAPRATAIAAQAPIVAVKTFTLGAEFRSAWQLQWVNGGSPTVGNIAFSDRIGNRVGFLNPETGETSSFALQAVTEPNGIAAVDRFTFAVAGTGGAAFFDSRGTGKVTELSMAGRRFFNVSTDGYRIYLPDWAGDQVVVVSSADYADKTTHRTFDLPAGCGSTGWVPGTVQYGLCGNLDELISFQDGAVRSRVPFPFKGAGAQEARRGQNNIFFSAFRRNSLAWYDRQTRTFQTVPTVPGPAVPALGFAWDPFSDGKTVIRGGYGVYYDTVIAGYNAGGATLLSFPSGRARNLPILPGRRLVGATVGPDCSFWVADSTPGSPAIHRLTFGVPGWPKTRRTVVAGGREIRYPAVCHNVANGAKPWKLTLTTPKAWRAKRKLLRLETVYYAGDAWNDTGGPGVRFDFAPKSRSSVTRTGPYTSLVTANVPAAAQTVTVTITPSGTPPNAPFGVQIVAAATPLQ